MEKDTESGLLPGLQHIERCSQFIYEIPVPYSVTNTPSKRNHLMICFSTDGPILERKNRKPIDWLFCLLFVCCRQSTPFILINKKYRKITKLFFLWHIIDTDILIYTVNDRLLYHTNGSIDFSMTKTYSQRQPFLLNRSLNKCNSSYIGLSILISIAVNWASY